jgi:serine/threonine-protein kinase
VTLGAVLGIAVLASASSATAADPPKKKPATQQAPSPPPQKRASGDAALRAGQKLLANGKFHEAAEKLAESYRIEPKTGTLLVLANAHEKEGRMATAWAEYKRVLEESTKQGNKKRAEEARTRVAESYKKIAYVKLDVGQSNATDIQIDGKIIDKSAWDTPQQLDPGPHEVKVGGANNRLKVVAMTLQPGPVTQSLSVPTLTAADEQAAPPVATTMPADVPKESSVTPASTSAPDPATSLDDGSPAPSASASTGSAPPPKSGGISGRTIGYIVGGVGLVGVGVGSYFGVVALGNKKDVDAHCATGNSGSLTSNAIGCDATGYQAQKDAHTNGNISTIAIGVGAAALVTGVVLIFISKGPEKTALHIGPTVPQIGTGGGAQIGGTF